LSQFYDLFPVKSQRKVVGAFALSKRAELLREGKIVMKSMIIIFIVSMIYDY